VKRSLKLLTVVLSLGLTAAPVLADQIFIQQSGTSPAGGDPNLITNTGAFVVGVAGNHTLQNPLLIIVGVYDGLSTPSISFAGCAIPATCPAAPLNTYHLTEDTATFTAASKGSAFDQLGLSSGGSESFGAWLAADTAAHLPAPTSFTLYPFALNVSLTGESPITIGESGAHNGSFIIAYGCNNGTGTSKGCVDKKGKPNPGSIGQTVITNSGLVDATPVPEPGSIALIGSGLLFLGGAIRRRFAKLA